MGLNGDELSAAAWEKLAPHLPGKVGDVSCTAANNRLFLNAVLWVMRRSGTWRALRQARLGAQTGPALGAERYLAAPV